MHPETPFASVQANSLILRFNERLFQAPLGLAAIHIGAGLAWILILNGMLAIGVVDEREFSRQHIFHGASYVLATGILLYGLVRWFTRRLAQTQEKLWQIQKLEVVGEMAASVAHDFNNVLTAVNGYSDLALGALAADHPARSSVAEVVKAGETGQRLVAQLMSLVRARPREPRPLKLTEALSGCRPLLEGVLGKRVKLEIEAREVGTILADAARLEQVLLNLAVNARDAMPRGGVFKLALGEQDDRVRLEVADTGCGMDPATLARAFEPFFTTKPDGRGTGLGLATVRRIIDEFGGKIACESRPGQGTRFLLDFPRAS